MHEERQHLLYEVQRRLRRGESKRGIARALGIAPKTVRRLLKDNARRRDDGESALERELPDKGTPRARKLDGWEDKIARELERFPDITSQRLLENLQAAGFDGQYTIVRQYLKTLRGAARPKTAVEVVTTAPGQQAQFDWSPYQIAGTLTVQVWSCTLSWSRGRSFHSSDNTRQTTILDFLRRSFEEFDGVPAEGVTDSMPGVVDRWECGRPIPNIRFLDFAAYYGFALHVAPRADGAYKGKVERPFWFLESNLLNGRTFPSREAFAEQLAWWTRERAMQRPHPETELPLWQMLEQERPFLKPLPRRPYDTREVVTRVVDSYAYVAYETNSYPVPENTIGDLVFLCIGPDRIEIFDRGVHRLAEHERQPNGAGIRVPDPTRSHRGRYDLALLTDRLAAWSPVAEDFARRLRERKRAAGPELAHLLGLQTTWSADDIVKAMRHALDYEAFDARAIERILQARFRPRSLAEQLADSTRERIRDRMRDHPIGQRPLSRYSVLRTGDVPPTQMEDHPHGQDHGPADPVAIPADHAGTPPTCPDGPGTPPDAPSAGANTGPAGA
ncbi:MAG: IS21 family transposase [Candidatus Sericytochromatia bacterium]|nr:IS21 family transposase [Candidatus Tanganyikabacteria bacterium]